MNSFIEISVRRFFENRPDLFGEGSVYVNFETDVDYSGDGGFNSTMHFGKIVYRRGNEKRTSESLILKQIPRFKIHSASEGAQIMNEILFYTQILPFFNTFRQIDFFFAQFYDCHIRISQTKKEAAMIFENLQASGFKLADRHAFLDFDHLSLMLRKLGNFHAFSLKAKNEDLIRFRTLGDLLANTFTSMSRQYTKLLTNLVEYGIRELRQQPQYSQRLSKIDSTLDSVIEFVDQLYIGDKNDPMSVLCHGDYLRGNVMFRYDNGKPVDLKMVDLAFCALASPVIDLVPVLYFHADQQMRNEHWDDLIDEYRAGLGECFPDLRLPTRNDILAQFKHKCFVGYVIASYFLGGRIAADNNLKSFEDFLPSEYENVPYEDVPQEVSAACYRQLGGALFTKSLTDILKDMIDREFI